MQHIRRRLLRVLLAILVTLTVGTIGFVTIADYPVFDAFYMSLMTITTVGYAEIHPLDFPGRVFNSFLIFFGVITLFLAVGATTQTIIELELNQYFAKRRVRRMIEKLNDHFIICGFGRVGRGAANELQRAGVPFIVLDNHDDKIERAMKSGMLAVLGDASRDDHLRDLGISRAKGLIAALSSDADNLFLVLSAKGLNPKLIISARTSEEGSEQKFRRAGADSVFAPYEITGARLAQSILRPHVATFLDFTTMGEAINVSIEQVQVSEHSECVSRSLGQVQLRRDVGVIVLAIRKGSGEMLFNPDADAQIAAGDYLIAMGDPKQLRNLEKLVAATL